MPSLFERDMEKKLAMRAEWVAGPMQRVFAYTEALLGKYGGPFVGGTALSIADLVVAQQLLQIRSGGLDGVTPDVLAPYPRLNTLLEAYLADSRVQAYRAR
jgi:glutathione S-transferase